MPDTPIGCEEALKALAAYLDGELPGQAHADVHRHLETCQSCYSRAEFERRLADQLAGLGQQPPDAAFQDRIRTLLAGFVTHPQPEDR